ncbi:FtsX-like permease family protein [Amycolatopsis sp., V23-08]|uniref:FtsX-like permease family protein n=1 Tax=Amycolatopsis heterodermiae TaxID=3110235 RepID=A0ABU5R9U9_9PSEU|nr:FtsX-like permease family protein [Amycolatopsis sp., V23-08]MEA5363027.1 FtsX-like permease family protein [Amycolatopsis sp., V23-08]
MLRTVLAGLRARPLRLLLSAVAIALGVAFVAGAFILSDAVGARLRAGVAFETRGVDASISATGRGAVLDDTTVAKVRAVPGVAAAEGRVTASAPLRDTTGRPRDSAVTALAADPGLRPFDLAGGRFPRTDGEIAMDGPTAAGRALGQPVTVFGEDGRPRTFTLVGTVTRPADSGLGGAPLVLLPEAVHELAPSTAIGEIVVRAPDAPRLVADLTRAVGGRGVDVLTGREAAAQLLRETAPDSTGLTKFFTAFAVLAMIVAAMVITNSFTILVTQRARELALLRCIGAGKRQVFAGVLAEAVVVGAVASVAGLSGGLGIAAVLQAITGETVHLPLAGRTIVAASAIGVLVTVAAAALPAWAATRVAPVEALRTPLEGRSARPRWPRAVVAGVLLAGGVAAVVVALNVGAESGAAFAVTAMVACLAALLAAGPLLAGPVVRLLGVAGTPLLGRPARLAALNADRNPKRTAASAAALTIGLAVVALVTTMAAGVEAGRGQGLDEQLRADFVVTSVAATRPLPTTLADTLAAVPGVAVAAPRHSFSGDLGPYGPYAMAAVRGDVLGSLLRPAVLSGRLDRLGPGELAVSKELAAQTGLAVGDTVRAGPVDRPVPLRVVAVYDAVDAPGADLGLALVDLGQQAAIARGDHGYDDSVLVRLDSGVSANQVRPALEQALAGAPLARLDSVAEVEDQLSAPLRGTLDLLWALTALAVLIAFAGIANTLSLSVLERTRESALLRALGLTRAGLGATIAAESVFVALLGAACGLALGVGSAWLMTRVASTPGEPVLFALPWARLGVLVAAAVLAAPLAALLPARRAARGSLTAGMAEL